MSTTKMFFVVTVLAVVVFSNAEAVDVSLVGDSTLIIGYGPDLEQRIETEHALDVLMNVENVEFLADTPLGDVFDETKWTGYLQPIAGESLKALVVSAVAHNATYYHYFHEGEEYIFPFTSLDAYEEMLRELILLLVEAAGDDGSKVFVTSATPIHSDGYSAPPVSLTNERLALFNARTEMVCASLVGVTYIDLWTPMIGLEHLLLPDKVHWDASGRLMLTEIVYLTLLENDVFSEKGTSDPALPLSPGLAALFFGLAFVFAVRRR